MILPIFNSIKTFEIDNEDFSKLKEHGNSFHLVKNKSGVVIRVKSRKLRTSVAISRVIMGCPLDNGYDIDHIDRDPYNNKKSNLREATPSQNACNQAKRSVVCSSKYKGVIWYKRYEKWFACVSFERKKYSLGYFNNEDDAAIAYNLKAIELHGEFAVLNDVNINLLMN